MVVVCTTVDNKFVIIIIIVVVVVVLIDEAKTATGVIDNFLCLKLNIRFFAARRSALSRHLLR